MNCLSCGAEQKKESSFCVKCGAKLVGEREKAMEQSPSPAARAHAGASSAPPAGADEARGTLKISEKNFRGGHGKLILGIAAFFFAAGMFVFAVIAWKAMEHRPVFARTETKRVKRIVKGKLWANYFDSDSGGIISKPAWSVSPKTDVVTLPVFFDEMIYYWKDGVVYIANPKTGAIKGQMDTWVRFVRSLVLDGDKLYISGTELSVVDLETKTELWKLEINLMAPPVIADDKVYLLSGYRGLVAVDAKSGKEIWSVSFRMAVPAPPCVCGDTVFYRTALTQDTVSKNVEAVITAVDGENGGLKWTFEAEGAIFDRVSCAEDTVFFRTAKKFFALSAKTGNVLWSKNMSTEDNPNQLGAIPAVAGDTVFVGGVEDYIYALDIKTGIEKWRYGRSGQNFDSLSATDKYIYASSGDTIYAFDANTGREESKAPLETAPGKAPMITDKVMFVIGRDNALYALPLK